MLDLVDVVRAAVSRHPHVRLVYLFGSGARRRLRSGSDIDVAVRFDGRPSISELGEIAQAIAGATGRRVDLIDLDTAPPLLQREAIKTGTLIHAASEEERIDFELRALARYMDTAHLRRVQHRALHEWAEEYRARSR